MRRQVQYVGRLDTSKLFCSTVALYSIYTHRRGFDTHLRLCDVNARGAVHGASRPAHRGRLIEQGAVLNANLV